MSLGKKVVGVEVIEILVIGLALFITAGTSAWPAGWVFLGLLLTCGLAMTWWLLKYDPGLIEERMRFHPQKAWDKVLIAIVFVFILFWLILMPLDAVRFHWSRMALPLETLGALVLLISLCISYQYDQSEIKELIFPIPAFP